MEQAYQALCDQIGQPQAQAVVTAFIGVVVWVTTRKAGAVLWAGTKGVHRWARSTSPPKELSPRARVVLDLLCPGDHWTTNASGEMTRSLPSNEGTVILKPGHPANALAAARVDRISVGGSDLLEGLSSRELKLIRTAMAAVVRDQKVWLANKAVGVGVPTKYADLKWDCAADSVAATQSVKCDGGVSIEQAKASLAQATANMVKGLRDIDAKVTGTGRGVNVTPELTAAQVAARFKIESQCPIGTYGVYVVVDHGGANCVLYRVCASNGHRPVVLDTVNGGRVGVLIVRTEDIAIRI